MKERAIVFDGPSVLAILAGRKTQVTTVIKPQPSHSCDDWTGGVECFTDGPCALCGDEAGNLIHPPHGGPGDLLWVREALNGIGLPDGRRAEIVRYTADGEMVLDEHGDILWAYKKPCLPAIMMPRWASRITLEITTIKTMRIQDMSRDDVLACGIDGPMPYLRFCAEWDKTHSEAKKENWLSNPWVWVTAFKRVAQ